MRLHFTEPMTDGLTQIRAIVSRLRNRGVQVQVMGGWGEELVGLTPPRPHKDLDLLCAADDLPALESLIEEDDKIEDVPVKRTACSRAFEIDGLFVDCYLARRDSIGWFTNFWGYEHRWPTDTFTDRGEFPVATRESLAGIKAVWPLAERAYDTDPEAQRVREPRE